MSSLVQVLTGADRFFDPAVKKQFGARRLGLVVNHTAVTRELYPLIDRVAKDPDLKVVALFGPEHGVRGDAQAGERVATYTDREIGLPVYSLYGNSYKPSPEALKDIDTLVFDIQDVGVRFFTYISTMYYCMEAAKECGVEFVVLDRPNPITGTILDGNMLDPDFRSFVGIQPMLLRHGMTVGEIAKFFNGEFGVGVELIVIEMAGWTRDMWFDATGLPWIAPSPNIPTIETAVVYPGTCLIEGTNVSEGRGTTLPFLQIGAPWIRSGELAAALNDLKLPGVRFRPAKFRPMFHKHAGQVCEGVQLHVFDREAFPAVKVGLHLIKVIRDLYPQEFEWRAFPGEDGYAMDRLMGTDAIRRGLEEGRSVGELTANWQAEAEAFAGVRSRYLIYDA